MTPQQILQAEQKLSKLDPVLGMAIKKHGTLVRGPRIDYFTSLARSIVGQQISVKAAATIFGRLQQTTNLEPLAVAKLTDQQIKIIGLSGQKARYIRDLAEHFVKDSAIFDHLNSLPDDQVIAELTSIKGIGMWTAQMFLMFTLVRPDVFAPDDVGLQQSIKKMYGLSEVPKRAELLAFAERWKPYRTVACWHLWHALDNEPD
jgi:DNA-3-methyladenine glycosylase II